MQPSHKAKAASSKTLYLIDISSFIFRAFYAIRSLSNKKGEPTNAVYGVLSMMLKFFEEAKPEYLCVTFDSKGPSFREELYADYKANRSAAPDELVPQFARIDELVKVLGMPGLRVTGVEADDLIATYTKEWRAKGKGYEVMIVSGDKDLMQLVTPHVSLWDTMANKVYDPDGVVEKFGVKPDQIRDYLGMVGDSSDNIPGIPSIGPKTASDLLKEYGDLDGVLKAADKGKITGKKGETLKANAEVGRLSAKLASLKDDVEIDCDPEKLSFHFEVTDALMSFLDEMEFHTLKKKLSQAPLLSASAGSSEKGCAPSHATAVSKVEGAVFRSIRTESEYSELLEKLAKTYEFGFDLESTSLNPRIAEIVGVALSLVPGEGLYIPVGHRADTGPQLSVKRVLEGLKPFLENPKYKKVGQNLKYDWSLLMNQGVKPDGIGADTMVAAYVLEPEGRHNMEVLAQNYLDYKVLTYEEVCGKGKTQIGFDQVPIDLATRYSAEDAWVTYELWRTLKPKLESNHLMQVFAEIDLPLVPVLARMECEGVCIDEGWLAKLSEEFAKDLNRIEERVQTFTKAGEINLNSPKQLAVLLFEELKLPPQSKTKTGFSTDASVLEALAPLHEVPRLLLEYREISKLKGTYVDPLPTMKDPKTGKIHAGFHQTVAATGRLSSADPNLQNIPIRSERGKRIRRAFIPSPGNALVSADYSQIELRLLAHMSQDPDLVASFNRDEDVHRRTASELFSISTDQVDDNQRAIAKAINFGLMYGKTAFGLASELGIPRREAQDIIDRYFKRYSGVKQFLDRQILEAREKGYALTLLGRRRNLKDINDKNQGIRNNAERMAMNTPIQGTAADLMKLAMTELDHQLTAQGFKSKMIIQVHDELVLDCPKNEVDRVTKLLASVMEGAMKLSVPLKVNTATGENWMEL